MPNLDDFEQARLEVRDLRGATPEVEAGLWRYLLDIDLVTEVTAPRRAVDDPLRWRLSHPRQIRTRAHSDMLWLRPLDLVALLEGRVYAARGQLVIDVADPPDGNHPCDADLVTGRWCLDAGPDGVVVQRARPAQTVDVHLGIAELGALFLGGVTATTLPEAGRVSEGRSGALGVADRLFAATPSPLSSTGF
ncbi:MAG: sterol carrier protein domain-containing protein [Actinomycetota bacterium]|nr:sterol carrier protein domain-containing protein [Actinomycetota bacterium]